MDLRQDFAVIEDICLNRDPAFRNVAKDLLHASLDDLRIKANSGSPEEFLFSSMQLLALPGNGHTRLVPNHAIQVRPIRFVAIGRDIWTIGFGARSNDTSVLKLVAINEIPVDDILKRAAPYLAGNHQRQRVIGAILLAWPYALRALGVSADEESTTYYFLNTAGALVQRNLDQPLVSGASLYPYQEKGRICGPNSELPIPANTTYLVLDDFSTAPGSGLETKLKNAGHKVVAAPKNNLVIDLRGNPGGDFLKTLRFIDRLNEVWTGQRSVVLVDKFTFSAAIVFAAILKTVLKDKMQIVGEPMGDYTRFYAEGSLIELNESGASVRYSTAYHDWRRGKADATTPPEIAKHLIAAGDLNPDWEIIPTAQDLDNGVDKQLEFAAKLAAVP